MSEVSHWLQRTRKQAGHAQFAVPSSSVSDSLLQIRRLRERAKLACSFTGRLGFHDSEDGDFLIPGPAPSTLHPQGTLLVAQSQHPRVRDQMEIAAQFQSIPQVTTLRATKTTTINTKYRS